MDLEPLDDARLPCITTVRFRLNGLPVELVVGTAERLIDLFRERLGLTGPKIGCRIGRCGTCAVLIDGKAVNGCLMMAFRLDGTEVITAEGLDLLPEGRAARAGLAEEGAFQCGYCAPGIAVALTALLTRRLPIDDAAIHEALGGNLCRCSGYLSIMRGATRAVSMIDGPRSASNLDPPAPHF